jgi:hypothetical protein
LEDVGAAELAECLLKIQARSLPLVNLNRSTLQSKGPVEITQPRITHSGVIQTHAINRELLEVPERQHTLEPGQGFVESVLFLATHAQIVQRPNLVVSVADLGCLLRHGIQQRFALGTASETEADLSTQSADVEPHVTLLRNDQSGFVQCVQGFFEAALRNLGSREQILLSRVK